MTLSHQYRPEQEDRDKRSQYGSRNKANLLEFIILAILEKQCRAKGCNRVSSELFRQIVM